LTGSTEAGSRGNFPCPPRWVYEHAGLRRFLADVSQEGGREPTVQIGRKPPFALVAAHQRHAVDLSAESLTNLTADLYGRLREEAASAGTPHPLRFWNFIPRILEPMKKAINRYMVFNTGRHSALQDWFAGHSPFETALPTATGVGHSGDTLHVYCLAGERRGTPTENRRQRPAYRYSSRYGPFPPCFARATLIDWNETTTLLIGGTASVRGEESLHKGSVEGQLGEAFKNLTSLLEGATRSCEKRDATWRIEELRTYFVRAEDKDLIRAAVNERFPGQRPTEMVQAELCRPELLVEIEGIASIRRR
jgi:enamine deaminase RidA (YjgF/YER057c/UK114 family)